jgi:hypothetical protein
MNANLQSLAPIAQPSRWLPGVVLCLLVVAGCDLGLEESSNRYQQMGQETSQLAKVLQQVTDEASAKQRLPEIQELGDKIREIQKGIMGAESNNPKGMVAATNVRQMQLFFQVAAGVVRNMDRIRETDPKAGEMVDEALQGIIWQ